MRIEFRSVNKNYQTGNETVQVLKDINFRMETGSWVAITGPSGSGKTTFMRCLSGIELPDSGQILAGQLDIMNVPEVPQRAGGLYLPGLSAV